MIDLNDEQYKMLCRINRKGCVPVSSLSVAEKEICKYLISNGCVQSSVVPVASASPGNGLNLNIRKKEVFPKELKLTQYGMACVHTYWRDRFRWRFATAVSLLALAVSIAAIVFSPFFTAYFTDLYNL